MIVVFAALVALGFVLPVRREINRTLGRNPQYRHPLHPTGVGFDIAVFTLVWFLAWLTLKAIVALF